MSINELDMKVKELRELRRMADELAGEWMEKNFDALYAGYYAAGTSLKERSIFCKCSPRWRCPND